MLKNLNIYNIGTQNEISIRDLAKKIANHFQKELKIIPGKIQEGSTKRRCPDISKICNLGFKENYTIEEGLKLTTEWYSKNIN